MIKGLVVDNFAGGGGASTGIKWAIGRDLLPYRTAADCIDWSIPCPSIFERKKPLVDNTQRRIAAGLRKYVFDTTTPFIIPVTHHGDSRSHSVDEPLRTITTAKRGEMALVTPTLIQTGYGERKGQAPRSLDIHKPLGTIVAGGAKHALVAAFLEQHNTGVIGRAADQPLSTTTTRGTQQGLVTSHLIKLRNNQFGQSVTEPAPTTFSRRSTGGRNEDFTLDDFL
jgi:DNA (cytosine-5)-methyltransferase 1